MINNNNLDIKEDNVYWANDRDLKINHRNPRSGHSCIVLSVNKKKKVARVKTITSLEHLDYNNVLKWDTKALGELRRGDLLAIPKKDLNSPHLSAIHHNIRVVKIDNLRRSRWNYKFPRRYKKLIHKK